MDDAHKIGLNFYMRLGIVLNEEFIKKFDQVWKRYIAGSDIQFGQQR